MRASSSPKTRSYAIRNHQLSACVATALPRYRDRHQARQGAAALTAGDKSFTVSTFACPECRGYHLEKLNPIEPIMRPVTTATDGFTSSLPARKRRYWLVDIENPTRGAKLAAEEVAHLWSNLKHRAPGVASYDHVVVGASRRVAHKYRAAIHGPNVKWVVGADGPDGADRALLAAIDLHRVARDYEELVIVSGDHAFADLARRAKAFGLTSHVITAEHPGKHPMLSRELAAVADTCSLVRLRTRSELESWVTTSSAVGQAQLRVLEASVA